MLVFRREQVQIFETQVQNAFVEQICRMMQNACPEECDRIGNERVRQRVEIGIEQAKARSLQDEQNIIRYVQLLFLFQTDELGQTLETAWAQNIFAWEDAGEDLIMAALEKSAQQALIQKIEIQDTD